MRHPGHHVAVRHEQVDAVILEEAAPGEPPGAAVEPRPIAPPAPSPGLPPHGLLSDSGRVPYAVISFGGFLGLGHSHYPVTWAALKYDPNLGGYITGITEEKLKDAPAFSDDAWSNRSWEAQVHKHYNAPPYWGSARTPQTRPRRLD